MINRATHLSQELDARVKKMGWSRSKEDVFLRNAAEARACDRDFTGGTRKKPYQHAGLSNQTWEFIGDFMLVKVNVGKTRCASGKPSMNVILGMPRFDILIGGLNVT